PSAGASGALFGLVGVLFVFGIKFRRELPEGFKRAFGTGMLPIILINLFIGYVGRGFIDNAAHLGGLLSGAALAAVVEYRRPGERRGVTIAWRILQIAAVAVILIGFFEMARNFRHSQQLVTQPVLSEQTQIFLNYIAAMEQARNKTDAVFEKRDVSNVGPIAQRALQVPVPDAQAAELRQHLLTILSRASAAVASASPPAGDGPRLPPPLDQKLIDEYKQWTVEYEQWKTPAVQKYTSIN